MVGFGSIGQGVLPLILRHLGIAAERITIITADAAGTAEAREFGIKLIELPLTPDNHRNVLEPLLARGDFLLNLSVDVSSVALVKLAHEKGALYLDTCIEPWPGGYTDPRCRRQAHQLRVARNRARAAPVASRWADRGADARRESRHGVTLREAGACSTSPRRWQGCQQSAHPRGVGSAGTPARGQGHPHRRARHAGRERPKRAGSSSTPGRWTASSAKAVSRPSWAGARTRKTCRHAVTHLISGRRAPSICCSPVPVRACGLGRPSPARFTVS